MNDNRTLQSIHLTDLSVPLKKQTVTTMCSLIQSLSSNNSMKTKLELERCMASESVICALLKSLTNVKQLSLNEMGLTD